MLCGTKVIAFENIIFSLNVSFIQFKIIQQNKDIGKKMESVPNAFLRFFWKGDREEENVHCLAENCVPTFTAN